MKIGILGTRGIPNHYGGFEQWAEQLSHLLVKRGCDVSVYNSHNHHYQKKNWNGVKIIHKYDPEYLIGTPGQFIYDLNCIIDSRNRKFDIILQLGYTSSSIWGWLLPRRNTTIITNMDGFEWSRRKYSKTVKFFLKQAERLGVFYSDYLIADSKVVENYYIENYKAPVKYIPYGTAIFTSENTLKLKPFNIVPYKYKLLIARLEPENNIEIIIKGVILSNSPQPLLIVGNFNPSHGKYLYNKYLEYEQIRFIGAIYEIEILNNLRYFSNMYFHGHSVGGTNPSLIEAMACSANICAHNNPFNKSVLTNDKSFFFENEYDIAKLICTSEENQTCENTISNNIQRVKENFLLKNVSNQYYSFFHNVLVRENE